MKQVLVTSPNAYKLAERRDALEKARFAVVTARTVHQMEIVCRKTTFDAAVIGYLYSTSEKAQVANTLRYHCRRTPLIELCDGTPAVTNPDYVLHSTSSEELAGFLQSLRTS